MVFYRFNWTNQGLNCKNIEVWKAIRDLIKEMQNQTEKRRMIVGVKIDQIKGQIEENSKFDG